MNAGKSTILLQAAHNYEERGMVPYLLTAEIDKRSGEGKIASRIGIEKKADTFNDRLNLYNLLKSKQKSSPIACVLIDEAQFLTKEQVWQLARAVDDLFLPVLCYGLRVDFQGNLFPGSSALLGLADELKEIKTTFFGDPRGVPGTAARAHVFSDLLPVNLQRELVCTRFF